jgi:hypothetical protein
VRAALALQAMTAQREQTLFLKLGLKRQRALINDITWTLTGILLFKVYDSARSIGFSSSAIWVCFSAKSTSRPHETDRIGALQESGLESSSSLAYLILSFRSLSFETGPEGPELEDFSFFSLLRQAPKGRN